MEEVKEGAGERLRSMEGQPDQRLVKAGRERRGGGRFERGLLLAFLTAEHVSGVTDDSWL
jgi:hypothetical protein